MADEPKPSVLAELFQDPAPEVPVASGSPEPPAPAALPAPAQEPASLATPPPPSSGTPEAVPTAPSPEAAGTTSEPAPAQAGPSKTDEYIRELTDQNRQLVTALQQNAEQTRAMMEVALKKATPEMSPEEREKKIQQAFLDLNADPEGFVAKLVESKLAEARKDLEGRFAPNDPAAEQQRAVSNQLQTLYVSPKGVVLRPELANQEFRDLMLSKPVTDKVYQKSFSHLTPEQVIKDPMFYLEAYHEARAQGSAAAAPNIQRSQSDQEAQRAILQGHGNAAGTGKTPASAQPKSMDDTAQFKADMVGHVSPTSLLMKAFQTPAK